MTVVCSYASLLQQFPKRRLDRSLHALLQKQSVLCLFSFALPARLRRRSTQCSFAAKEDALLWSVSVDDQPALPSATLCVEEGRRSDRLAKQMEKKVLYLVVSNPGIPLVSIGVWGEE